MKRTFALGFAVAAAATLAAVQPARAATAVHYVALGDSYSSGVGTDDQSGSCERSDQAYPQLYATAKKVASFTFVACSGATTTDVLNSQVSSVTSSTTLVSITIGGNDAGFSSTMESCILGSTDTCVADVNADETFIRNTLPGLLDKTYNAIKSHGPNAKVVVMAYPVFYDLSVSGCVGLSSTDRSKIDEAINLMDSTVSAAVGRAGTKFSFGDVRNAFLGHQICDGGTKWLHALNFGDIDESYHPNNAGHASGYEPVFVTKAG